MKASARRNYLSPFLFSPIHKSIYQSIDYYKAMNQFIYLSVYQVTVDTVVRALMVDMHKNSGETNVAVMRKQEAELVALCKKKIAESKGDNSHLMHREAFESNYKNIFGAAASHKIEINDYIYLSSHTVAGVTVAHSAAVHQSHALASHAPIEAVWAYLLLMAPRIVRP